MKQFLQDINEFFTSIFGSVGKWIMLAIFGIALILSIVLIIYAIVNIEKVIFYGLLIFLTISFCLYVYNKNKKKG